MALKELTVLLSLQKRLASSGEPPERQRRHEASFSHIEQTLRRSAIPLRADRRASFSAYVQRRSEWETGLLVIADFLGYDWEELTGDLDPGLAHEDESATIVIDRRTQQPSSRN